MKRSTFFKAIAGLLFMPLIPKQEKIEEPKPIKTGPDPNGEDLYIQVTGKIIRGKDVFIAHSRSLAP